MPAAYAAPRRERLLLAEQRRAKWSLANAAAELAVANAAAELAVAKAESELAEASADQVAASTARANWASTTDSRPELGELVELG